MFGFPEQIESATFTATEDWDQLVLLFINLDKFFLIVNIRTVPIINLFAYLADTN